MEAVFQYLSGVVSPQVNWWQRNLAGKRKGSVWTQARACVCVCVRARAREPAREGEKERGRASLCVFRGEGYWDLVITHAPVNNAVRPRASKCNISSRTYIYPL